MDGITLNAVPMMPRRSQGTTPLPIRSEAVESTLPVPTTAPSQTQIEAQIAHAEQRREAALRDIANKYVLGDTRLSMFYKDLSGQYVTRFVNLRDGKVTYIPEPRLAIGGGGNSPSVMLDA